MIGHTKKQPHRQTRAYFFVHKIMIKKLKAQKRSALIFRNWNNDSNSDLEYGGKWKQNTDERYGKNVWKIIFAEIITFILVLIFALILLLVLKVVQPLFQVRTCSLRFYSGSSSLYPLLYSGSEFSREKTVVKVGYYCILVYPELPCQVTVIL